MKLTKYNSIQTDTGKTLISTQKKIKDSLTEAAESLRVGKYRKKNYQFNVECQKVIKKRQEARTIMIQDPTKDNAENYMRLRNAANKIIRLQKRMTENRKFEEIKIYTNDPK